MDQTLLVFVTVAEKRNFTRAAEELCMTQPAVSQYIQTLERTVGSKLLERNNKYVRLNKAGEVVYHHAREILGLYTRMQCLVDDLLHTARGVLSIGASYTFGEYVLPHIIAALHERYPLVKPVISIGNTRDIAELVLTHKIEVGIIEGEFHHDRLTIEAFAQDQMYVVCSPTHRFVKQKKVSIRELNKEPWIIREAGSGTREATEKMFAALQFFPEDMMEFGSTQIIKESVEAGLGISLLSQWAVRKELATGNLIRLQIAGAPILRNFSLVTPAMPFHTKATEIFLDVLRSKEGFPAID
ncbi:MAG: LysR family transcriptional regulator [Negativicutes bacterium]|nr:LysR family transcriptional regulator [Negativicutes bacterium]